MEVLRLSEELASNMVRRFRPHLTVIVLSGRPGRRRWKLAPMLF
jgi:hypothetical protein